LGVAQFNGVIEIYPKPAFVAMVTKIYEFYQQISHNSAYVRDVAENLASNGIFKVAQFIIITIKKFQ